MNATVTAVSANPTHSFSKYTQACITLIAGLGVQGDAHLGKTTQHRYLVKKDPARANLTQVHLLHAELHDELASELNGTAFRLAPGQMGENILTRNLDLMGLPTGALLHLGPSAIVQLTGLREPCAQLNKLRPGLMKAVFKRSPDGELVRNAGVMAIVLRGGEVYPGDPIRIELPAEPHSPLQPV